MTSNVAPRCLASGAAVWREPVRVMLVLLVGLCLAIGGCGRPAGGSAAQPSASGSATAGQPMPAAPSAPVNTPAGYQDLLSQSNDQLAAALAAVGSAPSLPVLDQAVLDAAGVASAAGERLTTSGPVPPAVSADNAALAGGLRQLGRELAYLSQQINLHAICAGPTALAAISTAPSMLSLRSAATALSAARPDRPSYHWGAALPAATDAPRPSLQNDAVLVDRRAGASGGGVLRASDQGGTDAVLVLARGGSVVASLAVAAAHSAELDGIPDGDYDLFYTVGKYWDARLGTFSRHCEFHRFTTPTTFQTRSVPGGSAYTVQTIALHTPPDPGDGPVPEGPVPAATPDAEPGTTEVPPEQMPR